MPALPLLDTTVFSNFLQAVGQIYIRHAGMETWKAMPEKFPFSSGLILPQSLGSASGSRDDVLGSSSSIPGQFPLGPIMIFWLAVMV